MQKPHNKFIRTKPNENNRIEITLQKSHISQLPVD